MIVVPASGNYDIKSLNAAFRNAHINSAPTDDSVTSQGGPSNEPKSA